MQEVVLVLKDDGTVEVRLAGFSGSACKPVAEAVQRALGGKVTHDEPTAEASLAAKVYLKTGGG